MTIDLRQLSESDRMAHLVTNLIDAARDHPDRPAVKSDDTALTYGDLLATVGRVAGMLRARGLQPGDRIGLVLPNVLAFPILFYGSLMAGCVAIPLNPLLKGSRDRVTACVTPQRSWSSHANGPGTHRSRQQRWWMRGCPGCCRPARTNWCTRARIRRWRRCLGSGPVCRAATRASSSPTNCMWRAWSSTAGWGGRELLLHRVHRPAWVCG